MDMGERIKELRLEAGLTQEELGNMLGLQKSAIAKYENGRVTNLKQSTIAKMAEIFHCAPSYVMAYDDAPTPKRLMPSNILKPAAHAVPILGTICAGNGIVAEESFSGKFFIDSSIEADYCLQVKGDSMIGAEIYDGDYAFLRKATEFRNGQIYAVLFGDTNEASLKVVHKQGEQTLILSPCNDDYSPIVTDTIDCYLIGELVGVYHSHEN